MAPPILTDDQQSFLLFCKINNKEAQEIAFDYINKDRVNLDIQDEYRNTPLHIAVINNNENVFMALIKAGAKTDIENDKGERAIDIALLKCCEENNEELVLKLIEHGANVNCENPEGKRPLDCLNESAPNFEKIARLLIDNGALPKPKERLNRFERPNAVTRPTKNEHPKVLNSLPKEH